MARYPEAAWYALTWRQRREILRYARRGARHPDRYLARTALAWARYRLEPENRERRHADRRWLTWSGLLDLAAELAAGAGGGAHGGALGMLHAERRAARRILAAEHAGGGSSEPGPPQ